MLGDIARWRQKKAADFAALRRGFFGAACHVPPMEIATNVFQALRREILDHRASIAMLIRIVREQEKTIAILRAEIKNAT